MSQASPVVLVVDDSITVRKVLESILVGRGLQVSTAKSATEAIAQLEHQRPDLIVCDVVMPDKTGYDLCEFVRARPDLAEIPFVLVSGLVTPAVRERAAKVQATEVIGKPFSADAIGQLIDGLLQRRVAPGAPAPRALARKPQPDPRAPVAAPATNGAGGSLRTWVADLARTPGVLAVFVVDRDGFLLEAAGTDASHEAVPGALASCFAESSGGIGRSLGHGELDGMILEYERGVVVVRAVGATRLLAILLSDPAYLGKVRYLVKRSLPEIEISR
jgi:CheY-like chemotaxis protein